MNKPMENERLIELTAKKLTNEISAEDSHELEELLKNHDNEIIFNDLKLKWETSGRLQPKSNSNVEHSWVDFKSRVNSPETKEIRIVPILYRIAAVLVIAIGLGYFYFKENGSNKTEYLTKVGEIREIVLPDSSKIWLNGSSYLSYDQSYNDAERTVILKGEAFFEVAKNPHKPFIVFGNQSRTEVLGTSFNISAYDSIPYVDIDVNSGKVAFSSINSPEKKVLLTKGQSAKFDLNTLALNAITNQNPNYAAWRTKRLVFEDAEIQHVIEDLNQYFDIRIVLESQNIGLCRLTSTFFDPSIAEILQVLQFTLDIEHSQKAGEYTLSGTGCK